MEITVQTLDQKVCSVSVDDGANVDDLRLKIGEVKNIDSSHVNKIIFNGKILLDGNTLASYNVVDKSKVVILIKATPSKPAPAPAPVPAEPVAPVVKPQNEKTDDSDEDASENTETDEDGDENQDIVNALTNEMNQNPQAFMMNLLQNPMFQQYAMANPQGVQQMMQNPEEFVNHLSQMLGNMQMGDEDGEGGGYIKITMTENEKNDVDELVNMGFDKNDVLQTYMACDKNKEMTANILMDNFNQEND